jgi:hypothetical protein
VHISEDTLPVGDTMTYRVKDITASASKDVLHSHDKWKSVSTAVTMKNIAFWDIKV